MTSSSVSRASIPDGQPPRADHPLCADRMLPCKRRPRASVAVVEQAAYVPRRGKRRLSFMIATVRACFAALILVAGLAAMPLACRPAAAEPQAGGIARAAHLSIYHLQVANFRGERALGAGGGPLLYDFSRACGAYGPQLREVNP